MHYGVTAFYDMSFGFYVNSSYFSCRMCYCRDETFGGFVTNSVLMRRANQILTILKWADGLGL